MIELGCFPGSVLQQHSTSNFAIPTIQSFEWTSFLVDLEKIMELYPSCVGYVHQIHRSLAGSDLPAVTNASDIQPYDQRLILLVKQLWQSAHLQGADFEVAAAELLRSVTKSIGHIFSKQTLDVFLSNITRVESRIFGFIGKVDRDQSRLPIAVQVLSCVPKARLLKSISTTTCDIARAAISPYHKSNSRTPLRMHVWLKLLRQVEITRADYSSSLVDEAMASATQYLYASKKEVAIRVRVLLSAFVTHSFTKGMMEEDICKELASDLMLSCGAVAGQNMLDPIGAAFNVFLLRLRKQRLPQESFAQALIDLITRHAGLDTASPFLRVLQHQSMTLANPAFLRQLVAEKMASIRQRSIRTEKQRQDVAFSLHMCKTVSELLDKLASTSATTSLQSQFETAQAQRQLQHILTRAQIDHALPIVYRSLTTDMSVLESIHLIHQLAHHYSTDKTRTQREAWRAMYYLYRYLQRNDLHIGPLFSQAVVRLSVIRPMSENRFVSARRMIWVCHLVARVEGDVVAKQVEASLWEWRGELIRYAKSVYVSVGGNKRDKAHVGTMKKLGLI